MSTVQPTSISIDFPAAERRGSSASNRQEIACFCAIDAIEPAEWAALSRQAIEENVFLSPDYYVPLATLAEKAKPCRLFIARDPQGTLTALAPLVPAWKALRLPVPALVVSQPYLPLGTPLLADGDAASAAGRLIDAAGQAGAAMVVFQSMHLGGPVAKAFRTALAARGLEPAVRNEHWRAGLDASIEAETYLRAGLGAKKLKELRRQRNRLADFGTVEWKAASKPEEIGPALERFLVLEASGWKGRRGTALGQIPGDAAFIRAAAAASSRKGAFEICELLLNGAPVAAGLVFRSRQTAFFLKTAYDETHMRLSPGVQLTAELTRHFAADPAISFADSVAVADHPMIDHIWRERIHVGDFFVPTGNGVRQRLTLAAFDARDRLRGTAREVRNQAQTILARRKGNPS